MRVRIGINGFGRIGRNVFRAAFNNPEIEVVAVNDLPTPTKTFAHLLKYDSILGTFDAEVTSGDGEFKVNDKAVKVFTSKSPTEIPWGDVGAEIVIESTGIFRTKEKAAGHIHDSVKKVIITAPAKDEDLTIVMGVNEGAYDPAKHTVISNASCTTNCVTPIAKLINDNFGIVRAYMTTIHSYTNDQNLLDLTHSDLRRARAAAQSMIPSTTGAARMVGVVIPELNGLIDGMSIRVPTPNVSVVDLTAQVEKAADVQTINRIFKAAAGGALKGYLQYTEEPLVSKDYNGNPHSCIFDATLTAVVDKHLVKLFGWYDNEWGYSNRVVDLVRYVAKKGLQTGTAATASAKA